MIDILRFLPLLFFWSAILSFVPTTLYLLLINPPLYRAKQKQSLGIYVIKEEFVVTKWRRTRLKMVAAIYVSCLVFFAVIYACNLRYNVIGIGPFNVLSTVSVIFFWVSILSYLPIAIYLFLKNPWKSKEEGVCLTGLYLVYGFCMLMFSIIYAYSWLKEKQLLIGAEEIVASLLSVVVCSALLSYLPILTYVFLTVANPLKSKDIKPNTIFIIYSVCFLFFSVVYLNRWVLDKRAGVHQLPLRSYFEIL